MERATQQSYSYSLAGARVHIVQTLPLPLQYKPSQLPTNSLYCHLLDCLVRDSNYGLWTVTPIYMGLVVAKWHYDRVLSKHLGIR